MKHMTGEEREALLINLLQEAMSGTRNQGSLLSTLRKEVTGMNQEQYAARVGISRRTLSDIERDTGSPTIAVINRVFKPFGLKLGLLPRNQALLKRLVREEADALNRTSQ